ncbi:MAG: deoxynucleoside kinase [Candidatus Neomarinimicrobiota bacterium]|nr:deoxynucleoside kinase [Candidatus Neomarinimicrobiota bacterium]
MSEVPFVGIAGNISVGKTTLTTMISEKLGWRPFFESVDNNPYLSDFYEDMRRWSFHLQIYFLSHRFRTHREMVEESSPAVQDRTIYEDVEIFARLLHQMGNMTDRDWENYKALFDEMTSYLRKPTLIIYLKASTDSLMTRLKKRGRDYEKNISPEYLHNLNMAYTGWIDRAKDDYNIMTVETDDFNVHKDENRLNALIEEVSQRCAN